ncbi:MAG: hypothetical protein IPK67_19755 [Planctomycetes bacterium]|nr:hypothetical protein [Planctomycetota bacterium]
MDGQEILLRSERVADAVWLDALLTVEPESPMIPKLAAGLIAAREGGRWATTHESGLALLALQRYFRTYEAETPDLRARVWLGPGLAAEHALQGRQAGRVQITTPMDTLQALGAQDLVIAAEGAGRLYYRASLEYTPIGLPEPVDYGFDVVRTYEAVDDPADLRQRGDGSWVVRRGARVRVRVTVVVPAQRDQVALTCPCLRVWRSSIPS